MNKLKIKKLGILSVAKIYAAIMFVISLLISIPYGLFIIAFSLSGADSVGGQSGLALGGGGLAGFGVNDGASDYVWRDGICRRRARRSAL
jgi:hypothetical protein